MSAHHSRQFEIGLGWAGKMKPGEYGPLASYAEEMGIDALVVYSDLMFQPPIGPLLEMAAATQRVQLTLGCLTPYTVHPVDIAGQLAYLDAASNGRANLGLVRGAWLNQLGLDQTRTISAIRDTWAIVTRLLTGDRSGYQGKVFTLGQGLGLQHDPERTQVPLTIGTWSPKLAALAGEIADEVEIGGTSNPEMVKVIRGLTERGARGAGRNPDDLLVSYNPMLVVDDDGAAAEALARTMGAMYVAVVGPYDPTIDLDPELLQRMTDLVDADDAVTAGKLISDDLLRKFLVCGTPTQVVDHLLSLKHAGVDRVYLGNPFGVNEAAGLKLLRDKVLPQLRADDA